jgi:AcrR family transcriptional regulator
MGTVNQATSDTRELLIRTAERLFADRGIGAVSLREVGVAAGQRNTSAAKYHFGDKESLVVAVLDHRMRSINDRRLELLARMQAEGHSSDLRSLLEAFVYPLVGSLADPESHYARFLAQLSSDPQYRTSWDWDSATSLRMVWIGLRRRLDHLPEQVLDMRLQMLTHLLMDTVADHEHTHDRPRGQEVPDWAVHLVDAAVGMLTAPVSVLPRR